VVHISRELMDLGLVIRNVNGIIKTAHAMRLISRRRRKMGVSKEYIDELKISGEDKEEVNIPIPTGGHAIEVLIAMIKNCKTKPVVVIDNLYESIFSNERVLPLLKKKKFELIECKLPKHVPGYFAVFDDGYVFQKDKEHGFKGTGSFYDPSIANGMRAVIRRIKFQITEEASR